MSRKQTVLESYFTSGERIGFTNDSLFTIYYTCVRERNEKAQWQCMRGHWESFLGELPNVHAFLEHTIVPVGRLDPFPKQTVQVLLHEPVTFPYEQ